MSADVPDWPTIKSVLTTAQRAPSIHNSQPWRWSWDGSALSLHLNRGQWLPATDPGMADLVISCGAVLHHARIAFSAAGWETLVDLERNPNYPDRLAAIGFTAAAADSRSGVLATAIGRRRTDRRRYGFWPVSPELLSMLVHVAQAEGASATVVPKSRE